MFILITTILLTGCSQNPITGNYGPSWDMMVELPVLNSNNIFDEFESTDDFNYMGLTTTENDVESFYLIGAETEPIVSSISYDLPELDVSLQNGIQENLSINLDNNTNNEITKTITFPKINFGSTGNYLDLIMENTGDKPIDNLIIEIWDKNSEKNYALDKIIIENLVGQISKKLYLNNTEIEEKDLELRIKHEQSSGSTVANIEINGLKDVTVNKVKELEVENVSFSNFMDVESILLEIGIFDRINAYNNSNAQIKTYFKTPESTNIKFNINEITINDIPGQNKGDYYLWSDDTIELGYLNIDSSVELDNNILTYDSSDMIDVKVNINGKAEVTSSNEFYEKYSENIYVKNGDVYYTTPPMKVNITQQDISKINKNNIEPSETYFQADINNLTGVELKGDVYIANTSINLYSEENKVNVTKLEVNKGDNLIKRFLLEEIFNKVKDTITNGDIYIGFKLAAGDFNSDKGVNIEFTDSTALDINSSVFVKLKVNQ